MKKLAILLGVAGALFFGSCTAPAEQGEGWKRVDGVIVFDTPAREPGQQSVLGLRTAPMDTVRVGFIGLARQQAALGKRRAAEGGQPQHTQLHARGGAQGAGGEV